MAAAGPSSFVRERVGAERDVIAREVGHGEARPMRAEESGVHAALKAS